MATWLDNVLKQEKKAAAVHLQMKQQDLQQRKQREPYRTGQQPFQLRNEPLTAKYEAPAHKGKRTLGNLSESERRNTHSDVQRIAFKQNLLDNVKMDRKEVLGESFSRILDLVEQYANTDAVGNSQKDLLKQEQQLLEQILRQISARLAQLEEKREEAKDKKDEALEKEQKILTLYANYFALDTSGYLTVPEQGTPDAVFKDCSQMQMKGTYSVSVKGVVSDVPIKMQEVPPDTPLFSHEPSLNDVAQGGVGDCYLLAALSAIVSRNPQWIKDCMKDHGDGTVTVRLYEKNIHDGQTGFQANYVKIKKAIPEGDPYAKNTLWVQLIEHAYAASHLHHKQLKPSDKKNEQEPKDGDYNSIASGTPEEFMERILGREVRQISISKAASFSAENMFKELDCTVNEALYNDDQAQNGIPATLATERLFGIKAMNEDDPDYVQHIMGLTRLYEIYSDYFHAMKDTVATIEDAQRFFTKLKPKRLPDFPAELGLTDKQQLGMKRHLINHMKTLWLNTTLTSLPHESFSGKYKQKELLFYEEIKQSMLEGKMMVASTHENFSASGNSAGLNGESVENGMVSGHSYTLLGVKQIGETRYIKVRNPWAVGAREYTRNEITGGITRRRKDADTQGIFLVELNEFVRYYDKVGIV